MFRKVAVVKDVSDEFKLDAPTPADKKEKPQETDARRLEMRQKQIDYGKNTLGYERYCREIPKHRREQGKEMHPSTPDVKQVCSKRSFDGQVKKWRRQLHFWDPPVEEGQEKVLVSKPQPASVSLPSSVGASTGNVEAAAGPHVSATAHPQAPHVSGSAAPLSEPEASASFQAPDDQVQRMDRKRGREASDERGYQPHASAAEDGDCGALSSGRGSKVMKCELAPDSKDPNGRHGVPLVQHDMNVRGTSSVRSGPQRENSKECTPSVEDIYGDFDED